MFNSISWPLGSLSVTGHYKINGVFWYFGFVNLALLHYMDKSTAINLWSQVFSVPSPLSVFTNICERIGQSKELIGFNSVHWWHKTDHFLQVFFRCWNDYSAVCIPQVINEAPLTTIPGFIQSWTWCARCTEKIGQVAAHTLAVHLFWCWQILQFHCCFWLPDFVPSKTSP